MSAKEVGRIASGPASMTDQILEQIPTPVMAFKRTRFAHTLLNLTQPE